MKKIIAILALISMPCINAWIMNFKNNSTTKVAVKFYFANLLCNADERQLAPGQALALDMGSCLVSTVQLWSSNKDTFYEKKDYKPGRMSPDCTIEVTPDLKIQIKDALGKVIPDVTPAA